MSMWWYIYILFNFQLYNDNQTEIKILNSQFSNLDSQIYLKLVSWS